MRSGKILDKQRATRVDQHRPILVCLLLGIGFLYDDGSAQAVAAIRTFAFDDFDGDLAPDIASLKPVSSDSSGVSCIVPLKLSSGKGRSISPVAHGGDLRIVPRDVNGDRIPDLTISSAWTEGPNAVLVGMETPSVLLKPNLSSEVHHV
jgi:hypothetical protein